MMEMHNYGDAQQWRCKMMETQDGLGVLHSCCCCCPCTELIPSKQGLVPCVPTMKGGPRKLQRCHLHGVAADVTVPASQSFPDPPDPSHPLPWLFPTPSHLLHCQFFPCHQAFCHCQLSVDVGQAFCCFLVLPLLQPCFGMLS